MLALLHPQRRVVSKKRLLSNSSNQDAVLSHNTANVVSKQIALEFTIYGTAGWIKLQRRVVAQNFCRLMISAFYYAPQSVPFEADVNLKTISQCPLSKF